ncbi:MAX-like protein X [Clonorchis sinensis]|uniref:MAX-like protein X n=1 Tax=Clonorchis sinensis TaxID=79923 RepID=H2KRM7_CLOSI|nr:MAX-like protein X [Clonorchis sinensis]
MVVRLRSIGVEHRCYAVDDDNVPALVLPSGGMAANRRRGVTAELANSRTNLNDSESESEDATTFGLDDVGKDVAIHPDSSLCREKNRLDFEELESLFKFLDIAYTGKLTSPKWNQFHVLKNIKPFVVHFQPPPLDNHIKSEVTILEGQYWKRRPETICAEYNRWRKFTRNKILGFTKRSISDHVDELFRPPSQYSFPRSLADDFQSPAPPVDALDPTFGSLIDDIMMDFDENLDLFFGKPLAFPTPKDLALLGIGDIMQPGLLQFQPDNATTMDDPMAPTSISGQFRRPSTEQRPVYSDILSTGQVKSSQLGGIVESSVQPLPQFVFQSAAEPFAIVPSMQVRDYGKHSQQMSNKESEFERLSSVSPSILPATFSVTEGTAKPSSDQTVLRVRSVLTQDRRDRDQTNSRPFTKHSHQQNSTITSRTHPFKRHRGTVSGRLKGHSSSAVHPSDKALKSAFRNSCFEVSTTVSERGQTASGTPALLNALLHGTRSTDPEPAVLSKSQAAPGAQNFSNRSVPLLSSVLTSSSACRPGLIRTPAGQFTGQTQAEPVMKSRYCFSEPHRFQGTPSLVTDCVQSAIEPNVRADRYSANGSNIVSNESSPLSKRPTLPDADNHSGSLHTPSFTTECHSAATPSTMLTPPSIMIRPSGLLSDQSSVVPGQFVTPAQVSCISSVLNAAGFSNTPDIIQSTPILAKDEKLLNTEYTPIVSRRFSDFDGVSHSSGHNLSSLTSNTSSMPFALSGGLPLNPPSSSKPAFPVYTPYNRTSRQRTNSGSQTSKAHPLGNVSTDELRWPDNSRIRAECESLPTVETSLSARGRSSSAGNLFPLQHPVMSKPDLANKISSLGSTEVLSSAMCSQQPLVYTSPSCSPQPPTFPEPGSSPKTSHNNTTEDRRRHLMQVKLETLRQYIKYYGGHRLSSRRSENRELTRTHNSPSQTSNCAMADAVLMMPKLQDDSTNELLPLLKRPSCLAPHAEDPSRTLSSEQNNRTSYAATLFEATALIRMLREASDKRDAQMKSLMNEINSIQAATTAYWEKVDPMGAVPSRQLTEPFLTDPAKEFFRRYTEQRTSHCWKFYVFSLFLWELFQSYWSSVNSTSMDQFVRSLYGWLDQHCSRAQLRPVFVAPANMKRLEGEGVGSRTEPRFSECLMRSHFDSVLPEKDCHKISNPRDDNQLSVVICDRGHQKEEESNIGLETVETEANMQKFERTGAIVEALCKLAITTSVLHNPSELPDESLKAVHQVTMGPAIDRRVPGFSQGEVEMTTICGTHRFADGLKQLSLDLASERSKINFGWADGVIESNPSSNSDRSVTLKLVGKLGKPIHRHSTMPSTSWCICFDLMRKCIEIACCRFTNHEFVANQSS